MGNLGTFGCTHTRTRQIPVPAWRVRVFVRVNYFVPRVYPYLYPWRVTRGSTTTKYKNYIIILIKIKINMLLLLSRFEKSGKVVLLQPCSKRAGRWCRCRRCRYRARKEQGGDGRCCCCRYRAWKEWGGDGRCRCRAWKVLGEGAAAVLKKSGEVIEGVVVAAAVVTRCARIGDIGCLLVAPSYLLFLSSTQPESSLTYTRPRSSHLDSTPPLPRGCGSDGNATLRLSFVLCACRPCFYARR